MPQIKIPDGLGGWHPFALPKGDTGLTGATGTIGSTGPTGSTGTQGIQGIKGDTGSTGLQGIQGTTGTTGSQGIKGDTGLQGTQGIQGTAGTNGVVQALTAGTNITIDSTNPANPIINASAEPYTLPTASTTTLGGVKVDGSSITIANGIISGANTYTLPTSSTTVLGGVKVGSRLSIANGVLSADVQTTDISSKENISNKVTSISGTSTDTQYPSAKLVYDQLTGKQNVGTYSTDIHSNITALNAVTNTNTGDETQTTIKTKLGAATALVDGYATSTQITKLDGIAASANNYTLPTASTTVLGGVKVDGTSITISNGIVSSTATGSGDVVGPASATDSAIALFDTTTGKKIKNSSKTIVTTLGTDDTTIPTSLAVKKITDGKENTSNRVSSWQVTPDNTHYPTEKLVKDNLNTLTSVLFNPTTLTVDRGTLTTGVVGDLSALGGTDVSITELTGVDPSRFRLNFTGVTKLTNFVFYGYYSGGASHQMAIEIYNTLTTNYDQLGMISTDTTKKWYSFPIYNAAAYLSAGVVNIRFRHIQNGVATHKMILDYVEINYGGAGGNSSVGASSVSFVPTGDISSTNVAAALIELDTEKKVAGTYSTDIHANITALNAVSGTNTGDVAKAVGTDINTGTDDAKYVTSKAIKDAYIVGSTDNTVENVRTMTKAQYEASDKSGVIITTDELDASLMVENVLTSTSTTNALSAAQGKVLKDTIISHLMTATTTGRPIVNVATAYATVKVPLDTEIHTGTKLTFDNASDRIVIGSGVSKVIICANTQIFTSPAFNDASFIIKKNGTIVAFAGIEKVGLMTTYSISPRLISVSENDYFELMWTSNAIGNYTILSDGMSTYLTVEIIE